MVNGPEHGIDFDGTWNAIYSFVICGEYDGPLLGHRPEKCRKLGGGYDEIVVKKFETNLRSAKKIREILNTYMDTKRKEEKEYYQTGEIKLQKELPQETSLMIG